MMPNRKKCGKVIKTSRTWKNRKKKVKNFSLGMKQRLGIAMALLKNPEMIILDEPMNGLDPSGIVSMRKLLENLCVKKTKLPLLFRVIFCRN